jgi:hypothetical protein
MFPPFERVSYRQRRICALTSMNYVMIPKKKDIRNFLKDKQHEFGERDASGCGASLIHASV